MGRQLFYIHIDMISQESLSNYRIGKLCLKENCLTLSLVIATVQIRDVLFPKGMSRIICTYRLKINWRKECSARYKYTYNYIHSTDYSCRPFRTCPEKVVRNDLYCKLS